MQLLTDLLPHQAEAYNKLKGIRVGALFMEQGVGKTRTTLSLVKKRLDAGKVDAVLWLCPCSVKKNLREDITYHCGEMPEGFVIRGIESLSSSDRLYLQLLKLVETHKVFLVVDETTLTKNPKAIRTERITVLSGKCPYKLILNGTPISKNEADLFAQFYILDWRILGYQSYYSFAANHLEYWTITLPNGTEKVDKSRIKRVLNTDYLAEKIAPYTYQVRKEDCLKLPEKEYYRSQFMMTPEQANAYARVREEYLLNIDELKEETIYKFFSALQHVSSGMDVVTGPEERMMTKPLFADPKDNPRIRALLSALDGEKEKVIIFCKYQHEIDSIMKVLPNSVEFSGRLSQKRRQESRDAFRNDMQFFVSNKSCGAFGLNLQFCHKIVFYNNDFTLATRLQAEDRVHRIGQTHTVEILDIGAFNSIDGFITDCLLKKENLAEAFKEEVKRMKQETYGKINIGFSQDEKEKAIRDYVAKHPEVKHVIVFYPDGWKHLTVEAEYIPYSEIIMYRTYYPLLQKIDDSYLLVYDECLRNKNRYDLTYNCAHKYNNQTKHIMVFEFFPFIEEKEEFMILADLIDHVRMRPRKLKASVLKDIPTVIHRKPYELSRDDITLPDGAREAYEAKKKDLFDNLGKKDPDTIPNALEVFVGKWKKPEAGNVARNQRFKGLDTFAMHKPTEGVRLIDLPLRQRDFNDWLKLSGCTRMSFAHTGLPVDEYFYSRYQAWFKEVAEFGKDADLH